MVKLFIWMDETLFEGLVVALADDVAHARREIALLPQIENSLALETVLNWNPEEVVDLGAMQHEPKDQAWWYGVI
jgi:hypothetical protein